MERTPHWSSRASSDTVSFTLTYHTWQFIIFTIFTITAYIFSYSFSLLFWIQDLAFWQILSSIDLFLYYRTDSTDSRNIQFFSAQRLDLFAWCVMTKPALSRFSNALKIIASFISFHRRGNQPLVRTAARLCESWWRDRRHFEHLLW